MYNFKNRAVLIFIVMLFIILTPALVSKFQDLTAMTIKTKFEDLDPISEELPVYYKGQKIGKTTKMELSKDGKYAILHIKILKRELELPKNSIAKLRMGENNKAYIDIELPKKPSSENLKNNDEIKGEKSRSLESVFEKQIDVGTLDAAFGDFSVVTVNVRETSEKINNMADLLTEIIKENRGEINRFIKSTSRTSNNIGDITANINAIVKQPEIKTSLRDATVSVAESAKNISLITKNLESTTADFSKLSDNPYINKTLGNVQESSLNITGITTNIKDATENIKSITEKIDNSFCKIDCALDQTNQALANVNHLSEGVSDMLSKRFLLFKFMFGKPGDTLAGQPENPCCACPPVPACPEQLKK